MSYEKVVIGDATLYWSDCREVLPLLPACAAVVTDPPYGQAYKVNTFYSGGTRESAVVQRNGKKLKVNPNVYSDIMGDDEPFDPAPLLGLAPTVVLWGAHKFHDRLPAGSWLVWDKVPTGKRRDQGDGEAAWINRQQPLRIFRLLWDGLCVGEGARHEVTAGQQRYHPAPATYLEMNLAAVSVSPHKRILEWLDTHPEWELRKGTREQGERKLVTWMIVRRKP